MAEAEKTPSSTNSSGAMDKDDVISFLGDDSDEKEIIPLEEKEDRKEKKETKKSEGSDESKEPESSEVKEIEEEKLDEKKLELLTPISKDEVLKKYPNLFKDFPGLETTYHREQAFTERFPTIKDADNALRDSETLEKFEADLIDGNTENMLQAAKNGDPEAFNRIVDNYLTVLGEVDQKAYYHVIGNTIRYTIISMLEEAKSSSDDKLTEAAQILNYFIFGSSKIEAPTRLTTSKVKDPDKVKLANDKEEFARGRHKTVSDELNTKINKSIKNTIDAHIDPKSDMRDYDKRNATRDVKEELDSLIAKDTRFKVVMDKLWKDASKNNYNKESIDKIKSLHFSKVKSLLPDIIKKVRNEALSGKKPEVKAETKKEKSNSEKPRSISSDAKKEIPRGMTTLDFLNAEE